MSDTFELLVLCRDCCLRLFHFRNSVCESRLTRSYLILSTVSYLVTVISRKTAKPKPILVTALKYNSPVTLTVYTHVPLLYLLKISAHWLPVVASRFATMFLNHSKTLPVGLTCFHRAGLLLPMVVSIVTWRHQAKTRIIEVILQFTIIFYIQCGTLCSHQATT